jgi:uncharacterized membrane protein
MIVSLEAIFLSTFVMISQNRADGKRQVIRPAVANRQEGGPADDQLLDLSKQILELTKAIHTFTTQRPSPTG